MAESRPPPVVQAAPPPPPARTRLGIAELDAVLGGGIARARLHELYPASAGDLACAAGVALMLAQRAGRQGEPIVWLAEARAARRGGLLHAPGLADLGVDPARLLFVTAPDAQALLRAAGDIVRSPAAGIVVIAPEGAAAGFDLTATRRLTLFAERSGITALLLRATDPAGSSAAATRWRVAAAPSHALEADTPGHPAFTLELVRQRGGAPAPALRLEWDRDAAAFRPAPLSGDPSADAGRGLLAVG